MNRFISIVLIAVLGSGSFAAADCFRCSGSEPATQPTPAENSLAGEGNDFIVEGGVTGATKSGDGVDPEVEALLDRIERASSDIRTLQAEIRYDRVQGLLGDKQRRFGVLYFVAGPPAQFAAHFDRLLVDQRLESQDRWYIFDGVWLVEKLADQSPKQFFKHQIVPPGAAGEPADPLAVGAGPFLLPIRMKKDAVLSRFKASIVLFDGVNDPPRSVHLRLVPVRERQGGMSRLDLWYDGESLLPVRVRTFEEESENESIVNLTNHQQNAEIDPGVMSTAGPEQAGWEVRITPWEGSAK